MCTQLLFVTRMMGQRNSTHVSCFSHTWFIYNLNTTFIRCEYTWQWYIQVQHFVNIALLTNSPLAPPYAHFPFFAQRATPFYLLGGPLFGDHCANAHPHLSLVDDRLPTPCSLPALPPSQRYPQFMLHVFRDDITKSATQSDTAMIVTMTMTWLCTHLSSIWAGHAPGYLCVHQVACTGKCFSGMLPKLQLIKIKECRKGMNLWEFLKTCTILTAYGLLSSRTIKDSSPNYSLSKNSYLRTSQPCATVS